MRIEPDLSGTAVVLLGSFNPKIFQPFWLASHGLIPAAAAESADISVVHPEITAFSIEDQFSLSVERGRLSMDRNVAPFIVIADLLGRIFGDLLPHTPITRVGINRMVHFRARDEEHRERIGQLVAPREPWGDWGRRTSSGSGDPTRRIAVPNLGGKGPQRSTKRIVSSQDRAFKQNRAFD